MNKEEYPPTPPRGGWKSRIIKSPLGDLGVKKLRKVTRARKLRRDLIKQNYIRISI
jgi:hypothetical protein